MTRHATSCRARRSPAWLALLSVLTLVGITIAAAAAAEPPKPSATTKPAAPAKVHPGKLIYQQKCASCHGPQGEGVADVHEMPLAGERPLAELAKVIDETMPEEEPELCQGKEAEQVAAYIFDAFYSPQARARLGRTESSRIELARLTARQHRNTVADLLATFLGEPRVDDRRGLSAQYFKGRRHSNRDRVEKRIDPQVKFDYGEGRPLAKITDPKQFAIRWEGAVLTEDAGEYEFYIRTENGARLWINDSEVPLIDAWVSSRGRAKEHKATIRLLAGRVYRLRLDVFKFKDKTASIELGWKPPHKAAHTIPERNLFPGWVPEAYAPQTRFPPDDRVSGYERGVGVSQAWHDAATSAAVEVAGYVIKRFDRLTGAQPGDKELDKKARAFCERLAERAFRRPLTDAQKQAYVHTHFEQAENPKAAVNRSVLMVLTSPWFLYPELAPNKDGYLVASRLSYGLWNSLPDKQLLDAAAAGRLRTPEQVESHAVRMLADPRARAKLRCFLHEWLMLDEKEGLVKDAEKYPGFDEQIASDLRTSLDLFLNDVLANPEGTLQDLLSAESVYLNKRLAEFYGVAPPERGFEPRKLDDQRAGVVTHPYLMAMLSYHNQTSPIHRGVFVTRRLLGRTLKPPPQATEFKDGDFEPHMTTREKVEIITQPAACQSCHTVINPLGFSLEHFDAVGRFRQQDNSRPVNTSSDYATAAGKQVKLTGARSLAQLIATSEQAHGAFVDQVFHQAVKQPINAYGPGVREKLIDSFRQNKYNIRRLLVEVMKTAALHGIAAKESSQ